MKLRDEEARYDGEKTPQKDGAFKTSTIKEKTRF